MSMKQQKIIEIIAALALLAVIVAYLSWPREARPQQKDNSLARVMAAKKMVLGLTLRFPPMGFRDDKGEFVGFDIDMGRAICAKLGLELAIKEIKWADRYAALDTGAIDCLCNGIAVTPERMEKVDFPAPYLYNELVFVVDRDRGFKEVNDLTGAKVGVLEDSTGSKALRASGMAPDIRIVELGDTTSLFDKLQTGEIDAALTDSVVVFYYLTSKKRPLLILPGCLRKEQMAIAFRKGNATLRDAVQAATAELQADGTLAKLSVKWFGTNLVP